MKNITESPFKFLDSYREEDKAIFFGRDVETGKLYEALSGVKHLLVYGPSGAGKTSLIECGLRNKFSDADWFALTIRREKNMSASVFRTINEALHDKITVSQETGLPEDADMDFGKAAERLFEEYYQPVYLLFDQFEELLISGEEEEKRYFFRQLDKLIRYRTPCRVLLVMREEFIGHLSEYEHLCPGIFGNRFRLEKMNRTNVQQVIEKTLDAPRYKNAFVSPDSSALARQVLGKLPDRNQEIELTHVQVFLGELWNRADSQKAADSLPRLDASLLRENDSLEGVLDSFLKDQLKSLEPAYGANLPLETLTSMITGRRTKLQLSEEELERDLHDKEVKTDNRLPELLTSLENRRILRKIRSGEQTLYELSHDVLALVVGRNITEDMAMREKAADVFQVMEEKPGRLSTDDLELIGTYRRYRTPSDALGKRAGADQLYWKEEAERQEADRERRLREAEEQARKEAELRQEAESALEQADASRRRATKFARGAVVLAVLALGSAWYAYSERNSAEAARVEAVSQGARADSSARIANKERVRADSSAQLALEQKAIAEQKTAEAENNLQRAEEEELRAKSALDQVRKEKSATEAQRLRAEDNYRIAEAKTAEAESAKEEAERNLENVRKSNEAVVRAFLKNARENWQDGRYREAYSKIVLADAFGLLSSEVMSAYLDNKSACLANAPDYGLALESVSRAYATGALSRERMTDVYVGMADTSMLNLYYDTAQIIVRESLKRGAHSAQVGKLYLDLSYWYCEVGKLDRSLALLDRAYMLSGRELSVSGVSDTVSLHRLMFELSGDRYNELRNRYYPVMVKVSGGTFDMGDVFYGDKAPRVTLSSFMLSRTEVTVFQYGLYCALMDKNIRENIEWPNSGDNPVVNVSWYDAIGYSNWLSERMGLRRQYDIDRDKVDANNQSDYDDLKWTVTRLSGSNGYRLPTESEWEYAARGGEKSSGYLYAGGDSLDLVGWYNENSGSRTHAVGGKLANELGLYDMSGNVWEWCWDWYGDYDDEASTNPQGADKGGSRVFRGGSWYGVPQYCRAAYRSYSGPTSRSINLGFRLASPLQ